MKKIMLILVAVIATIAGFTQASKDKIQAIKTDSSVKFLYTCIMHPEVLGDKPGKCPKCGMELVKKKVDRIYTCPMDPEVLSDKPGKCSKCGMDLVEKKPTAKQKAKT